MPGVFPLLQSVGQDVALKQLDTQRSSVPQLVLPAHAVPCEQQYASSHD
jgi:hypothetical protein